MEQGLINKSTLNDIATAINTRTGETDTMKPSEMADKISGIPNGLLIDSMEDLYRNVSLGGGSKYLDYNELITTGREIILPTSDPQITGGAPYTPGKFSSMRLISDNFHQYAVSVTINSNGGNYNTATVSLRKSLNETTSATVSIDNPGKFYNETYINSRGLVNSYFKEFRRTSFYATLYLFIDEGYNWGDNLAEYLSINIVPNSSGEMAFHYATTNTTDNILGCSYKKDGGHYLIGVHTGTSAKTLDFSLGNVTVRDSQSSDYENCSYFVEPFAPNDPCYYGCCLDEMFIITSESDLETPLTSLSTSKRKRSQVKYNWTKGMTINDVSRYWYVNVYQQMFARETNTSTGGTTSTALNEPCMYDTETLEPINEIHGWVYNSTTKKYEKGSASISLQGFMSDEVKVVVNYNTGYYYFYPLSYDEDLDCFIIYDYIGFGSEVQVVDDKVLARTSNWNSVAFRNGEPDFSIGLQSLASLDYSSYQYLDITLKGE